MLIGILYSLLIPRKIYKVMITFWHLSTINDVADTYAMRMIKLIYFLQYS